MNKEIWKAVSSNRRNDIRRHVDITGKSENPQVIKKSRGLVGENQKTQLFISMNSRKCKG